MFILLYVRYLCVKQLRIAFLLHIPFSCLQILVGAVPSEGVDKEGANTYVRRHRGIQLMSEGGCAH